MNSEAKLRTKPAECQALADQEPDETRKAMLTLLRDMWIALADESESMGPRAFAREITAVEEIHASILQEDNLQ